MKKILLTQYDLTISFINKFIKLGLITVILTLILSTNAKAEWIDDFFTSAVATNASSAKSQQRGYYTAGGFTARVPYKREPLMTLSLPTIQTGCGGIDMFWGGISFMNADYLVKKAEGVLKNAPYVLFSIGLKALSTQFGDTIEAVQAIVDQLNQLQLDECAAAKGLVNMAVTGDVSSITNEWDRLKTNTTNLVDGVGKTWNKVSGKTNNEPKEEKKKVTDSKIKDMRAKELLTGTGYVLEKLVDWGDITEAEANAVRALVGDVNYNNDGEESNYKYRAGCAANATFDSYLAEPTPFQTKRDIESQTCKYSSTSIYNRTQDILSKLYDGYTDSGKRQTEFDGATLDFLNRSGIPVMAYFSTASMAGNDYLQATVRLMGDAIAAGYAYGSVETLSASIHKITNGLRGTMSDQRYYVEGIVKALDDYNSAITKRLNDFRVGYDIKIASLNSNFELTRKSEQAAREINEIRKASYLTDRVGR